MAMTDRDQLLATIHQVRRRWRTKLLVRGAAATAACGAAALVLAAWGLQWMRFTPESILFFRIAIGSVFCALAYLLLARPLMRRVSDEQVALYLEEHEPSLEAAIISAIEAEGPNAGLQSPALVRRLIESAIEKVRAIEDGRRVEREPMRRYAGTLGAVVILAAAAFLFGPAYMRHALSALLVISRSVEAAAPYRIEVKPGHATIPRGADQAITAQLVGFQADQASLMIRRSPTADFERLPLMRSDKGDYEGTLFDVSAPLDYFVEAIGVRSPIYSLKVAEMPYVQRLELEYHFPAYTGLQPRKIEDGGDIAVLRGTEVHVRAFPTMTPAGGQILIDDKTAVPLTVGPDGALTARFTADHDGFYKIELDAPNGPRVGASPKYSIDVLKDQPPSVSFAKPGRDTSASPIEEVFLEAKAEDDYGVKALELIYSVNGGAEKTVKLFDGTKRMTDVSAGHTLYLEELNVQPGDSVSYYARALDNDAVGGSQRGTSDIYFIRVRPLEKDFRKADSQAGQGGGQQNQVGALSEQQRQIIAATFNLQRDRKTMSADRLKQSSVVVALMQKRLREQVTELLGNFATRVSAQADRFKKITDFLEQSVPEMSGAEAKLQAVSPEAALAPEQRSLEFLQKAEEEYELQVSASRNGGSGGGGGDNKMAEELADLFELEVDRMANQYETAQRAQQQQSDQKIDELAEKLKELARRQEQEAERQRRRAASGQAAGGGESQRALADQAEEAARQLERLAREENRPELAQSARRLQQAADAMRRAAAGGDPNASAEAASAIDQLREAERQLSQSQAGRGTRDIADAQRQADALAREQQDIQNDVQNLDNAGAGGGDPSTGAGSAQATSRTEKVQQLTERKNALAGKVEQLERQLDQTAASMFKDERDASRKLSEAANGLRDRRVRDKIRYSSSMLRGGSQPGDVAAFEKDIQSNLDDLRNKIGDAASAVGHTKPDATAQALDKARQLAQGMDSLEERMRNASGRGQNDRSGRGQNGQQAQDGQQGRGGQQGQQDGRQGQSAQQGQSGRQGQSGQQGQNGQQGQGGQQGQDGQNGQRGAQGGTGGRNSGEPTQGGRNGEGDTQGGAFQPAAGAMGDSRPGPGRFSPEDIRQFRGEIRQRTQDAEQLRRLLKGQNIDAKDLDEIMRGLRQLDEDRAYQNPEALARLQGSVTESVKRFEYTLRRRLDANANQVFLSGNDDVPEQYRKLVEQYYRSLSKAGGKQ